MSTEKQTELQTDLLDGLLDATLDDLADIPEFKLYPEGAHKVAIHWNIGKTLEGVTYADGPNKGKLKQFIELKMTGIETVELPEGSTETPIEKGAEAQCLFDLANEFGQGKFKACMNGLAASYGAKSNRELMTLSQAAEVVVVVKHRQNKEKTKKYLDIVELIAD
jgi:hypothetical protein